MSRRERRKSAAALAYDAKGGDNAPRVIAKGYGLVAEMIIQRAQEAGLYVHRAPEMVSLLMQVDLDSRIPPELYQAVAELLAWLYRLESGVADEEAGGESVSAGASSNTGETEAPLAGRYDYPRLPT
ncbi:MAG TPA: EscU/YscU/HrcU family type III secretion system export apparatus switch protein [Trinickia sp.]|uniref:EscU/YscU/HrcU family type III secretion system export apparatus switch protein n=1 Tax=Trinickia sp. TaxID=2571163 RepID=UPI002CEABB70|nr:EscU/YscU/HrcU family type III secretion system export apparatus switch protein [Trinickia sp.]HVW53170.1 EscU/YscU/HrcU family type III secretion system export apparatus switch protein [Trinickia sp.]